MTTNCPCAVNQLKNSSVMERSNHDLEQMKKYDSLADTAPFVPRRYFNEQSFCVSCPNERSQYDIDQMQKYDSSGSASIKVARKFQHQCSGDECISINHERSEYDMKMMKQFHDPNRNGRVY